jgi:diguanylate cyclase (GGDEF)-like protein
MTDVLQTERPRSVASGRSRPLQGRALAAVAALRDRPSVETAALLLPLVLVAATQAVGPTFWVVALAYMVLGTATAYAARERSGAARAAWNAVRVLLSVAMVAAGQLLTGSTGLLSAVYLPIIAIAAFAGWRVLLLAALASVAAHLGVEVVERGSVSEALGRALGFAGAAALVAAGTTREVTRLRDARERLRRAARTDRRRARQIGAMESIGRILTDREPGDDAVDAVVERIRSQFGFHYVSIYLGDASHVRLAAQRGYDRLIEDFDGGRGIVGRVMHTGRPAFLPDVSADPEYWSLNPDVVSEICVPLLAHDEFLGFVNVEAIDRPLDATDLRLMVAVADRIAAALIIARERRRLQERADLFRHIHEFSEVVNGTLQRDELFGAIVRSVSAVVPSDVAALHVRDAETGRFLLRATEGDALATAGHEARPGEGMAGTAIAERGMVTDTVARPVALGGVEPEAVEQPPVIAPLVVAASIPLIRDRDVLGVLTVVRTDTQHPFTDLERDALAMLGEQAAMGVSNVLLHAEVAELAVRDPLTGLFNRRYLDPALEQLLARRSRLPVVERVPLAAVMFDLDHFSELNNRHGHQTGDEVLRVFGSLLRDRMRQTDLVARYGGEEFVAILFRATLDDALAIADQIRSQLAATAIPGLPPDAPGATVSAGCAAVGSEDDAAELLRAADLALYMAKRAGRDRVCAA